MEQHTSRVVLGPILRSYPPFLVRQQTVEGIGRYPYYVLLPKRAITMPFREEEYQIASTFDSRDGVPWVIYALREWLSHRPRVIRHWEDRVAELELPGAMERLRADLKAEWEVENLQEGKSAQDLEQRALTMAERILANRRDELERVQQLTQEVTQGLHTLEATNPETVAAVEKVAQEIRRNNDEMRRRSARRSNN